MMVAHRGFVVVAVVMLICSVSAFEQEHVSPTFPPFPTPLFFSQRVDHSAPSSSNSSTLTFPHRYFVNDRYFDATDPQAPIMLVIGPEFPIDNGRFIRDGTVNSWYAQQMRGLLALLETRFYGVSIPIMRGETDPFSLDNLQLMTFSQIVADLHNFVSWIAVNMSMSSLERPVIIMGGSYAAMIAVAYQVRYPLSPYVVGAFASSAPLRWWAGGIPGHSVNAFPQTCINLLSQASTILASKLATDSGRVEVSRAFNTCTPLTSVNDSRALTFVLLEQLYTIPQFSGWPNSIGDEYTVTDGCNALINAFARHPGDALSALADFTYTVWQERWDLQLPYVNGPPPDCLISSWELTVAVVRYGWPAYFWVWCNEYPFFESVDPNTPALGPLSPFQGADFFLQLCRDAFGDRINIDEAQAKWIALYGDDVLTLRNTLLSSGTRDIYWPVTINGRSPHIHDGIDGNAIIQIIGASHCQDAFNPVRQNDSDALKQARATIVVTMQAWVAAAERKRQSVSTNTALVIGVCLAIVVVTLAAICAGWWYCFKRQQTYSLQERPLLTDSADVSLSQIR